MNSDITTSRPGEVGQPPVPPTLPGPAIIAEPPTAPTPQTAGSDLSEDLIASNATAQLTCSNPACGCVVAIVVPCPHGDTYLCACGHPFQRS